MKVIKRVALVVGGGFLGGLVVWLYMFVFAPDTSLDNAVGIMLIGLGGGCIAALMLTKNSN